MNSSDFKKRLYQIAAITIPLNMALFISMFLGKELSWVLHSIIIFGIASLVLTGIIGTLFLKRSKTFFKIERKLTIKEKFLYSFPILLPLFGLYYLYELTKDETKSPPVSYGQIFLRGFLVSLGINVLIALPTYLKEQRLTLIFSHTINPTGYYILQTSDDIKNLIQKSDEIQNAEEFLSYYETRNAHIPTTISGQVVAGVLAISKFSKESNDPARSLEYEKNKQRIYKILSPNYSRTLKVSAPFGLYLISGNIELAILLFSEYQLAKKQQELLDKFMKAPMTTVLEKS